MAELAPYALTMPQNEQPEGEFLLPLCVTRERLQELLNALKLAEIYAESLEPMQKWDVLEALAHIDDPTTASCFPVSDCDEDTNLDNPLGFIDGILDNIRSGGISKAIGYVIENYGEVIFTTALKVVGVTVLGYLTGGTASIFVNEVLTDVIEIGADELVDFIIEFPTADPTNILRVVYDVAIPA